MHETLMSHKCPLNTFTLRKFGIYLKSHDQQEVASAEFPEDHGGKKSKFFFLLCFPHFQWYFDIEWGTTLLCKLQMKSKQFKNKKLLALKPLMFLCH